MPTLGYPYSFTNGTTADAGQVDANFAAVSTVVNGLDNANVGAAGFYASQIIPTASFQAQFGGALGYTFAPGVAGQVPLTLTGVGSGQTADLFDVFAGTNKLAWIDNIGQFHLQYAVNGSSIVVGGGAHNNGTNWVADAATANLMGANQAGAFNFYINSGLTVGNTFTPAVAVQIGAVSTNIYSGQMQLGPSGSAGTFDYGVTNSGSFTLNKGTYVTGSVVSQRAGSTSYGLLPPLFGNTGGLGDTRSHIVVGLVTAAGASTSIALSGAAAFSTALVPTVYDSTANTFVTAFTTVNGTTVTWASTSGHTYWYSFTGW